MQKQKNRASSRWKLKIKFYIFEYRALKDQGYESDSTLVFRKKDSSQIAPLSPVEQKQAYLNLQAGGEAPLQGFRKPAPERPKGMLHPLLCPKQNKIVFSFFLDFQLNTANDLLIHRHGQYF